MKIPQSGIMIDNPAFPLLRSLISYWGITSGAGAALGNTLVCADLDNEPSYVGQQVKILSGPAAGQEGFIQTKAAGGILTILPSSGLLGFTNAAGALQQITGGVLFVILSNGASTATSATITAIWNAIVAMLTLDETGGTLTTNGAVQILWENNAPFGCFEPLVLKLDFTAQTAAESVTIRLWERLRVAGAPVMFDEQIFAGVQYPLGKYIDLKPNRFGVRVTLQQTAGVAFNLDWEIMRRE